MRLPGVRFTVRRMMLVISVLVLIWGGAAWGIHRTRNRLTVENRSGQPIALVLVAVSGSTSCVKFEELPDGAEASATFRIEGDGSFYIHGRLWAGVDYGAEFGGRSYGYVSSGWGGERVRFVIGRGGEVVFSQ